MRLKKIIRNPNFSFLVVFLSFFFYYLLVFNSSLYYHHHQPIFLFYKPYFKEFLLYPGGPSELFTKFFSQFFLFDLFGALFISVLSVSVFIIAYKVIGKILDFKYSLTLSFLPVALLLIIQNNHNYPLLITVKSLFALIFFLVYVKIPQRYKVLFISLSFLIYYILGGWIYLFYVVLCIAYELLFRKDSKKYIYAGLNVLVYFIYPYIAARYFFIISLKDAYLYIVPLESYRWPFNFNVNLYSYLFFLSFPVLQIAIFVYLKYIKAGLKKRKGKKRKSSSTGIYDTLLELIYILIVAVLLLRFSYNRQEANKIQIDYLAQQDRWEELLDLTPEILEYDVMVNYNVNRALYHTGQLLDNLFGYPQMMGADVLFLENVPRPVKISAIDLYFDLGHIRAAQVLAYEGQTHFGYNPKILKSVVMTNIINEEYNIAERFLDILNKSIMHKKWVRRYRNYISDRSLIKSDSLIQLKRKLTPKFDFFIAIGERSDMDLIELLKENGNNKMAFEYLMAYYLLEFRLGDLVDYLGKFKELGYGRYPHYIEEAILVSRFAFPSKEFEVDYSINQQTIEGFERFNNILSSFKNKAEAESALRRDFYHTYWYYSLYMKPEETNLE